MEKQVRWPNDFIVDQCQINVYPKNNSWSWHCLSCKMGAKRPIARHLDAIHASNNHRREKEATRQHQAWKAWWYREIITTDDAEYFRKLWSMEYPLQDGADYAQVMRNVQGDGYIRKHAESLNPELRK